jgi:hypothetical protein
MRSQRRFALALGLLALAGCDEDPLPDAGAPTRDADVPEGATVYYVVRHTERDPGLDPPINAEGEARAEALADRLEGAGLDAIVTTRFIRGPQSGRPLADRLGLDITMAPFEMGGSWPAFAEQVASWQRAREVEGQTYLMIGHSGGYNTTLLRGLGADVPAVAGERYEDLVILTRAADGAVTLTEETYGGPSSLDP